MIDRFEILASKIRYLVSRNRWSARLLGYRPVLGHGDEPGLILIQVDGLGEDVFRRALAEGRMPFTKRLIEDEGHLIHSVYSGMGSNTPNFQGELFYGVKTCVPGFGFRDSELRREFAMNHHDAAKALEDRLDEQGEGLLRGGSAWSDIYSGGADEPHLCASTVGLGVLIRALNPLRLIGLVVWHGWSIVRVLANFVVEIAYALWGFVKGTIAGRDFAQELRFIPERVFVSAVMREIVTAGACIDAERGLPVIHVNLLGYDEHAHRRGPDSRFALWTLKGLDRSIRRLWLNGHRSRWRDYQIWIYSDHGQEAVEPYSTHQGDDATSAILRVVHRRLESASPPPGVDSRSSTTSREGRSEFLGFGLRKWLSGSSRPEAHPETSEDERPHLVHRGPVGFVYLPEGTEPNRTVAVAEAIAFEASVPTVLIPDGPEGAIAWTRGERFHLPADGSEVFGPDHPHLAEITKDTLRVVHHESAGDVTLFGWSRNRSVSFKAESGAHGGPGPRETSAFLIYPKEIASAVPDKRHLRPLDLRELCRHVLDPTRPHLAFPKRERSREPVVRHVRLMTYNVHGCRGMDGRYSAQRISRVIASARPDVICLQELDQSRTRSGAVDQVHEIAAQLETEYHFHPVIEIDDGRFGNAVLSHYPLTVVRKGALPQLAPMNLAERGVLWVEVDVEGLRVQILNTHLSILRQERHLQAEALTSDSWLRNPALRTPLVLAGDLNASMSSWTIRRLEDLLRNVSDSSSERSVPATWSSRIPMRRIDHVFTSEDCRVIRVEAPRTRLSRAASDHLPLVVDLECRHDPQLGD